MSRQRDSPGQVDLCLDEESSEEEPMPNPVCVQLVLSDDRRYDSGESEDIKSGFIRYRERHGWD